MTLPGSLWAGGVGHTGEKGRRGRAGYPSFLSPLILSFAPSFTHPSPKKLGNSSTSVWQNWPFPDPGGPHSTSIGYGSSSLVRVLEEECICVTQTAAVARSTDIIILLCN